MTQSKPAASHDIDADGLPMINPMTFDAWMNEAMQSLPAPEDVAALLVMLRWYAEIDRQHIENPNLPKGLTVIERSTFAVIEFLRKQHFTQPMGGSEPLKRLQSAFVDIADGNAPALFRPIESRAGRHGKGVRYETLKGLAARTLSELIEGGDNADEAATRIAKLLGKCGPDMTSVTSATVKNWRNRAMEGKGAAGMSDTAIYHFSEPLSPVLGKTPKARGECLLKSFEEVGRLGG